MSISALSGEGVPALIETGARRLTSGHRRYTIAFDAADGASAAWLHAHGEVLGQISDGDQTRFDVRLSAADHERFQQRGIG